MEKSNLKKPILRWESSWDDGGVLDLKIVELLAKYKLPGVFYIPTNCRAGAKAIKKISENFEIGGHTNNHPQDLKILNDITLHSEIRGNKKYLEVLINRQITKFCYPRGRYDDRVIAAVKSAGFTEARTTKVLVTKNGDPFQKGTTIHIFQRKEYHGVPWWRVAKLWAHKASQDGGIFHIWGHSAEIDRDENWEDLENFFDWVTKEFQINN